MFYFYFNSAEKNPKINNFLPVATTDPLLLSSIFFQYNNNAESKNSDKTSDKVDIFDLASLACEDISKYDKYNYGSYYEISTGVRYIQEE